MVGLDKSQQWWGHFFCMEGWQQNVSGMNLDNNPILRTMGRGQLAGIVAEIRPRTMTSRGGPGTPRRGHAIPSQQQRGHECLFCDGTRGIVQDRNGFPAQISAGEFK